MHNSLSEELDEFPQFRAATNRYQLQLISQFKRKQATAKRRCSNPIDDSKSFYDSIISESPTAIEEYQNPSLGYKNGLLHHTMDDDIHDLHWNVGP